jgi:hypothetical protein
VLDFPLALASATEKVTVQDTLQLEVDPSNNASALVIRGKEMEAVSDDRDDLAADLAALAGPAAGPNGGQIYIDATVLMRASRSTHSAGMASTSSSS